MTSASSTSSISAGIGRIWGAKFCQGGKEYYAIPFRQGGKIQYWEYDGGSLRKQMLKAPLKYTRISSKFTYARKHPIYKVYRPHTGVDYAAPKGTPVHAVADGVVTFKGWGGGGGNTLKIKHAGNLMTGYLHLSGYAKGISKGSRVSQGQLIGYVGSTGASTGPRLRLPHLEKRHADQSAENPPGTGRTDLEAEPRDVRICARPYRGRTERRSEGRERASRSSIRSSSRSRQHRWRRNNGENDRNDRQGTSAGRHAGRPGSGTVR